MGRSLKEALLGQYAALQEAGLAPTEVPQEDEAPLVVVESAPRGRATRPRRESVDRYLEADDLDPNGQFDRDRRRAPRREHRGEELGRDAPSAASGGAGRRAAAAAGDQASSKPSSRPRARRWPVAIGLGAARPASAGPDGPATGAARHGCATTGRPANGRAGRPPTARRCSSSAPNSAAATKTTSPRCGACWPIQRPGDRR